ncbi:MAG: VOC family protein [Candidatus Eremiobacteraeota bacterium]|nr:VOC family protein [Candidatus Eremiobacteraeota bacterium]MBV8369087.1 VOC family protein [Candidatus Eremiobacteraeota bacterium]
MATFALAMIVCSDLKRSKRFYKNILELKLGTDAAPHWIDFDLGDGRMLGLHPASESLTVKPGSLQLGFHVDDVDKFVTDARTAGVTVLQEPHDESFGRIAVIADPDGYPVQVATPKPWR